MPRLPLYFGLFFALLAPRAWAICEGGNEALLRGGPNESSFTQLFVAHFNNPQVYTRCQAGYCDLHVYNFLKIAEQNPALDLTQVRVLFIPGNLYPLRPRIHEAIQGYWGYHAVMELNGRIFDFDYLPERNESKSDWAQRAIVDDAPTYFAKMFGEELRLRAYPASFYLRKYEQWDQLRGMPWAQGFPFAENYIWQQAQRYPEINSRELKIR